MLSGLRDFTDWLRVGPFEFIVHLVGLLISTILMVLYDEGIWPMTDGWLTALFYVFMPLWCADITALYFNVIVFCRRLHFQKLLRVACTSSRGTPYRLPYRPTWFALAADGIYSVVRCLCLFLFKLLLYQKLTVLRQTGPDTGGYRVEAEPAPLVVGLFSTAARLVPAHQLTYSMVFSPLIILAQVVFLAICIRMCVRRQHLSRV